jgi:hypothetical protein
MEPITGSASLQRANRFGFPAFELVGGTGAVHASLGRSGWFRVFFGRGTRIELPDGTRWRLKAAGYGPYLAPLIIGEEGKLVVALPESKRRYGINGRDYAYHFYPEDGRRSSSVWILREHETDLAVFRKNVVDAHLPVAMPAVLLCFTMMKYGIPGEGRFGIPELRWT